MSPLMGFVEFMTATPRPSQTRERPPFRPLDDRGDQGGSTETETGEVTVECLTVHREICAKERAAVKACVQTAKRRFYCEKIDSTALPAGSFSLCPSSELLGKSSTAPLPSDIPCSTCPIGFLTFSPTRLTFCVTTWTSGHVSHRPLPFLMVHRSLSLNR